MSRERQARPPYAITTTDQLLVHLADQLDELIDVLHERLPEPAQDSPATPVDGTGAAPASVDITEPAQTPQPRKAAPAAKRATPSAKRPRQ